MKLEIITNKYDLEKLYRKIQLTIIHLMNLQFIETIKSSIHVLKFNKIDMTEHDFDHLNISSITLILLLI